MPSTAEHDERFVELHRRIGVCQHCHDLFDSTKSSRRLDATPRKSKLFLVAQALGEKTQRLTGVPFVAPDGALSATGRRLEGFLGMIGFSLRPRIPVDLGRGRLLPHAPDLKQAYNSEVIQCFPGKKSSGKGDAVPREAVRRCMGTGYLVTEIDLVDPVVVLLLGSHAYEQILRVVGGRTPGAKGSVTETLDGIANGAPLERFVVAGKERVVVPIIHPSGLAAGRFRRFVTENQPLIDGLKTALLA